MPSKSQQAAQAPPVAPEDPLAELREPATTDEVEGGGTGDALPPIALVTQDTWDQARAQVIAGWHGDPVSLGFLHKGGNCGCHYLAGIALQAAMPVQPDLEPLDA